MASQERRPYKLCQADRSNLRGLVAGSLEELKTRACETLNMSSCRMFLEQDGTEIVDEEYFQFLKPNTKIMALSECETWQSGSEDEDSQDRLSQSGDEVKEGLDFDVTDSGETFPHHLITRIKRDPAFFVSFPDEDLESVIKISTKSLSLLLHRPVSLAKHYQDASQCELDRRLRSREATELLKLFKKSVDQRTSPLRKKKKM